MLFVCRLKILHKHCHHSWELKWPQENLKTMLMQNFGATNKEHYGMLWYFLERSIAMFCVLPSLRTADAFPVVASHDWKCVCCSQATFYQSQVQICLAASQVLASGMNTDYWLDKITRESRHFNVKQVFFRSVKRATCKDFVAKNRTALYFLQQLFATCNIPICCKTCLIRGR